jgi:uncharacterized membrane protein
MKPDMQGTAIPEQSFDKLTNHIVTVSKLQIALKAGGKSLQAQLNEIGFYADTASPEALFELLQQAATALLDYEMFWTHVLAISETVYSPEEARTLFNEWLNDEQNKLSFRSLTNADQGVTQRARTTPPLDDIPEYIVVTLLMGTTDEEPLFTEIYSNSVLRDVLDDIQSMSSRDLLLLEVLWSPQSANDTLTEAELERQYPELVEIA